MAPFPRLNAAEKDNTKRSKKGLFELPNEILVHALEYFQTQPLLQFRTVSHRFQNLIIRIVHGRLLRAASLRDRKLILECYHPSAQYTEPYLYCDYLGTPGLSDDVEGQGAIYDIAIDTATEGTLRKLYSRFRPTRKDPEPNIVRSHPAGDVPGSRTSEAASSRREARGAEIVKQIVSLEAHELFTQLCFSASLVQVGPRRGVFLSNVDILDKKIMRVWRQWLADSVIAQDGSASPLNADATEDDEEFERTADDYERFVWVDRGKIAGLKVRVVERQWRRDTLVLLHKDEDQAVSYSLELEEMVISTTHLMLAVERSLLETNQESGRAMVFGSFATAQDGHQTQDISE